MVKVRMNTTKTKLLPLMLDLSELSLGSLGNSNSLLEKKEKNKQRNNNKH